MSKKRMDSNASVVSEEKKKGTGFQYVKAAQECAAHFCYTTNLVLRALAQTADNDDGSCFPGYEYLMHFTSLRSKSSISGALTELSLSGVLKKQRRFSTSNKYHLSLEMMHKLRKPFLSKFNASVLKRINNFISEDKDSQLTQDIILAMDDDKYIWDVLEWYVCKLEKGTADEATPSLGSDIESWGHWRNLMLGVRDSEDEWYRSGYKEIRSRYLREHGFEMSQWCGEKKPEVIEEWEKFDEMCCGRYCGVCASQHFGCCDPELKKIAEETLPTCDICGKRFKMGEFHPCARRMDLKKNQALSESGVVLESKDDDANEGAVTPEVSSKAVLNFPLAGSPDGREKEDGEPDSPFDCSHCIYTFDTMADKQAHEAICLCR